MFTSLRTIALLSLGLVSVGCADDTSTRNNDSTGKIDPGNGNGNLISLPAFCPPADLFQAAVCVCDDFDEVGTLNVLPGPSGVSHVGVNGLTTFTNEGTIAGDLRSYGGFDSVAELDIGGSLHTSGDASGVGVLTVAGNYGVGGNMSSVGELSVGGDLQVAGEESIIGERAIGNRSAYDALAMPCACDGDSFFDVAAAVAAAEGANDNEAAGFEAALDSVGETDLRLESGSYYLADPSVVGETHLTISGQVSLFVNGSLSAVGEQDITLEDGASLDLFVSGSIATVGQVRFGSEADPSAFRLYVGGEDAMLVSVGEQDFFASIYAPRAEVDYVGDTRIVGSVFAKSLTGVGNLEISYGSPIELEPSSCEPPPPGNDEPVDEEEPAEENEEDGKRIE